MENNIQVLKGNVIDAILNSEEENVIEIFMHGANCFKTMGAGIALEVRNRIPLLCSVDTFDKREPIDRLGKFSFISEVKENKIQYFVNLYSQFYTGRNFDEHAFITSLRSFMYTFREEIKEKTLYYKIVFYLPFIGCGIGGFNKKSLLQILEKELKHYTVKIFEL